MKRIYILLFAAGFLALASCIDDDSTYDSGAQYIKLGGLEEKYEVVSFSGQKLELTPTVNSTFADSDLEYTWSVFSNNARSTYVTDTVRIDTISHDRNLSYPVNFVDGTYTFAFTVSSKSTGYSNTVTTSVSAASALSKGYYILKEDADGNTELDFFNSSVGTLQGDLLKNYQGTAMRGKPRCIDVVYQQAYIDEDTDEETGTNALCVTTEANEVQWIRTVDCKTIFTPENIHFEQVPGEVPYRTVRGYWETYYVTSNGCYSGYSAVMGGSGVLGAYDGTGGSVHVVSCLGAYGSILYWANESRSFEMSDYNGGYIPAQSAVPGYEVQNTNLDCIACGSNTAAGNTLYFLMRDKDDSSKKYIYYFTASFMGATLTHVRELDSSVPFANATLYATNAQQATIAYYVRDNKVYTYDFSGDTDDKQLSFEGLPAGEQISYVSNRFCGGSDGFDYLIIGTQTGSAYKVYMYEMRAGEAIGQPKVSFSGTGRLSRITYLSPNISGMTDAAYYPVLDQ